MKRDFWVLAPKNLSDSDILNSFKVSIDDVLKFSTEKAALEYREYGDNCEVTDVARKIRLNIEVIE